jgi:glycosyltransferase involved in cell wall biosynthesis
VARNSLRILGVGNARSSNFAHWARRLAKRGHEVHVVSGSVNTREGELDGLVVHRFRELDPLLRVPVVRRYRFVPALAGLAQRVRPDVVHAHYLLPYGYWAARAGTHPLVVSPWGTDALVDGRPGARGHEGAHEAIAAADLVVVNSQALERAAAELDAPAERVRYVLWHVDLASFGPERRDPGFRGRLGWPEDAFVVLSLRNFRPDTHVDVLVRAFDRVRREEPGARLVLAARGGPLRGEVEQLVDRLGLQDLVAFVTVPLSELPVLIASADVAVTLTDSDSSPPSLLESMASGLPLVATPAASIEEWVQQGDGAEIVSNENDVSVADALLRLAREPELRARYGERNRRVVLDAYGDPTAELERIYEEVTAA